MTRLFKSVQKYSGIAGIAILWSAVSIGMLRTHLRLIDQRPISYLGTSPASARLFSGGLIASALLFIWFAYYVCDRFKVKNRFLLYFLIGQAGQIVAAVFPYGEASPFRLIHTYAAFTLAFSLPFLIREFSHSQATSKRRGLYINLLRFEQLTFVVGIGLFVFTKGIAPLGEALPTIGFHVWILIVSVIALKRNL